MTDRTTAHALRPAALAALLCAGLLLLGLAVAPAASADTTPAPGTPATVSADALGTVQVDGVVWSMVTVGNTVYATGSFSRARPAGAAPGTQEVTRANLVAFDIRTGAMTGFAHTLNGQGRTITASPDGSRIYVGGDFTTVDGIVRQHVAAFDTATGALVGGFAPNVSGGVYSIAATAGTVYVGGNFTVAGGQTRPRLAAFSAATGALTAWAPSADHIVRGLLVHGDRILMSGQFSQVNGAPAVALASVDTAGGAMRTWNLGITNSGDRGGAWSLEADDRYVYVTMWGFTIGNIEGTVALDPDTLGLVWMNDCHGDPYDTWSDGAVVYGAGHPHDCETSGSFPDQVPTVWKRAIAMTTAVTGTLEATTKTPRYTSWEGRPHPEVLDWFPDMAAGTFTGQNQAAWSVTGGGDFVVFGGEFPTVNGGGQQALVRFARTPVAPDDRGPELSAAEMTPTATSTTEGRVTVTWPSSWDMDNERLTYTLSRTGTAEPIHTVTAPSQWWDTPLLRFTDTVPPGTTASYRVTVSDPFGNSVTSAQSNTVTAATTTSGYANGVLADGAAQYWRLGETGGGTASDHVGTTDLVAGDGVDQGVTGALAGDAAIAVDGTAAGVAATESTVATPANAFSVEAWVRTSSSAGGVVLQYGDDPSGAHEATDRALYVDSAGRLSFGVSRRAGGGWQAPTEYVTVRSPAAVTDGRWHHAVATVGAGGTTLYLDGAAVAQSATITTANTRVSGGHWTVGSGALAAWTDAPASSSLAGAIDEVAVYPLVLGAEQVARHHALGTGAAANTPPTAAFAATANGLDVVLDAAGSADPDGTVEAWAWDFGDGRTGSGATAAHSYAAAGTYPVTLTVTDDDGATAATTRQVTVEAPPAGGAVLADDSFGRTVSGGLGTADVGGPWTASAGGTRLSVADGSAQLSLPAAGNNTGAFLGDVTQTSADLTTTFALTSAPTGTGTYLYLTGRRVGAGQEYRVRVRVTPTGQVYLAMSRLSGGSEAFPGGEVLVPGLTWSTGTALDARVQVTGTGTTDVRARVWAGGTAEPATWQLERADTTAALQAPGGVGLTAHRPGGTTAATAVRVPAFRVTGVGEEEPPPANEAPTAAFDAGVTGLSVAVDASASTDADGTVAAWAWDFGDGRTATGATATHTYAAAGSYPVTLTVTDDDGATGTTTRTVTVEEPEEPPAGDAFAADAFDRTATGGLGAADVGGAWTATAGATRQSVSGGEAVLALPAAGNNTGSYLGVSRGSADVTTSFTLSAAPTGAGTYVYVTGRRVAAGQEYRVRVRVAPGGQVYLTLSRLSGGTEAFPGGEVLVPGLTWSAGTALNVRVQVSGSGTTTVAARVWGGGQAEPGTWQLSRTDTTAALQAAGGVGLTVHRPGGTTAAVEVRFAGFTARPVA
ncbi:PKD domain-containing protein [Blastococcus sp. SYSU D00669]